MNGLIPCYYTNVALTTAYRTGSYNINNTTVRWSANGYRLPTEAEWEKATRGGLNEKRFAWGDTISHTQANYKVYSSNGTTNFYLYDVSPTQGYHPTYATGSTPYTSPVGSFSANGYGLYDMAGNVGEWCWDWLETYPSTLQTDPRGATFGAAPSRIQRDGNFTMTTADRTCDYPSNWNKPDGFRTVRAAITATTSAESGNITVDACATVEITTQPASSSINSGGTTTLSVAATGVAPISYQWYQGESGTTTTPVGTNSSSFTTPVLFTSTNYWVKVINAATPAGANSDTATVTPKIVPGGAVGNVRAAQCDGTKRVDIDYDITGIVTPVMVSLEVSADGGRTWTVPSTTLTGALGHNIVPGNNLRVTWNAGADWNNQSSPQTRFRIKVDDLTSTPADHSLIPRGSFDMGDTGIGSSLPTHTVNVSAFYMQRKEVVQNLWDEVRAWGMANGYPDLPERGYKTVQHPLYWISWYAMVKWCNARSQKEGFVPCYYMDAAHTVLYRTGSTDIDNTMVKWMANGYRLPTEAEWEKAARGGLSSKRFPWGDTISHTQANFYNNGGKTYQTGTTGYNPTYKTGSTPYTSPVGSLAANGYGLYDMTGNVQEFCWDWYGNGYYGDSAATDPHGPATGSSRVWRGGAWNSSANGCRVVIRGQNYPSKMAHDVGFRTVRTATVTAESTTMTVDTHDTVEIAVEQPVGTDIADGAFKGFGSVVVGSQASLAFTIKNNGNSELTGLMITKDGTSDGDFTVTSNPVAPVGGAGGVTTFTVQFVPTAVGPRSAAIHIANNDSDENPFDIILTGKGVLLPSVATTAASEITEISTTLSGTVNPNGFATTAQFEYGLTDSYGSMAGVTLDPADGSIPQTVTASLSALQAGRTYHCRLSATNGNGTSPGADMTFSTYLPAPYTRTSTNGMATITGYTGNGGAVSIPSAIYGLPVSKIGNSAFQDNASLTSVVIPASVTSIGDLAFASCPNLTGVNFLGNAPTMGSSIFSETNNATVYRLSGATGWPDVPEEWGMRPTALWILTGSLQVALEPAAVVSAVAQWRVDAGDWQPAAGVGSECFGDIGQHHHERSLHSGCGDQVRCARRQDHHRPGLRGKPQPRVVCGWYACRMGR